MTVFCPVQKNLPGAKLNSYGLTALEEEISKQPSVDYAVQLLVTSLMYIYNKGANSARKNKKMYILRVRGPLESADR